MIRSYMCECVFYEHLTSSLSLSRHKLDNFEQIPCGFTTSPKQIQFYDECSSALNALFA